MHLEKNDACISRHHFFQLAYVRKILKLYTMGKRSVYSNCPAYIVYSIELPVCSKCSERAEKQAKEEYRQKGIRR